MVRVRSLALIVGVALAACGGTASRAEPSHAQIRGEEECQVSGKVQRFGPGDALTVWKIRSLKERFRVYVDAEGVLRCDHAIRFVGFPVLHLHYRIQRKG